MLFMMLIGAPPYQVPKRSNPAFNFIVKGRLGDVLKHWKRLGCVSEDALDLMNRIFKYEPERIKMEQILAHPFLKEQAASHKAEAIGVHSDSANVEEKGDSAEKESEKRVASNEETAQQEQTVQEEAEAGQPNSVHSIVQSESLSAEYTFVCWEGMALSILSAHCDFADSLSV